MSLRVTPKGTAGFMFKLLFKMQNGHCDPACYGVGPETRPEDRLVGAGPMFDLLQNQLTCAVLLFGYSAYSIQERNVD
jgi:hypothetical protein